MGLVHYAGSIGSEPNDKNVIWAENEKKKHTSAELKDDDFVSGSTSGSYLLLSVLSCLFLIT